MRARPVATPGQPTATHGIGISALSLHAVQRRGRRNGFRRYLRRHGQQYWSYTNTATYGSALSYIPEIPWNGSCAGSLVTSYLGFSTPYGPDGFCASSVAMQNGLVEVVGGSGGPSNCATGVPAVYGVVGGTCQGYAKPSWQTGLSGIPKRWRARHPGCVHVCRERHLGPLRVMCYSDAINGGALARALPAIGRAWAGRRLPARRGRHSGAGQPESTGSSQGNPNYVYYKLAASTPSVFHTVTMGDIAVNCGGAQNCYGIVGTLDYGRDGRVFGTTYGGALSVSSTSFTPAYTAGSSWNLATGIGSIDVTNLVQNWTKGQ